MSALKKRELETAQISRSLQARGGEGVRGQRPRGGKTGDEEEEKQDQRVWPPERRLARKRRAERGTEKPRGVRGRREAEILKEADRGRDWPSRQRLAVVEAAREVLGQNQELALPGKQRGLSREGQLQLLGGAPDSSSPPKDHEGGQA